MSTKFTRENSYIVIKRTDAARALTSFQMMDLDSIGREIIAYRLQRGKPDLNCLVIESDWPEYEPTWKAIEDRMADSPPAPKSKTLNAFPMRELEEMVAPAATQGQKEAAYREKITASVFRAFCHATDEKRGQPERGEEAIETAWASDGKQRSFFNSIGGRLLAEIRVHESNIHEEGIYTTVIGNARLAQLEVPPARTKLAGEAQLIDERDAAENAADKLASLVLGEPIDWSDHAAKWEEAIEQLTDSPAKAADATAQQDWAIYHANAMFAVLCGVDGLLQMCREHFIESEGVSYAKECLAAQLKIKHAFDEFSKFRHLHHGRQVSDCIFNFRVYQWHFQILKDWTIRISRNDYHKAPWPDGRIKLYKP